MIEIRNCSKAFGEIHAIDHVLMEIGERQIFGLVGTNGAGKSTLLRMAAGVIKPDEGEILVDQEPVYENEKIKQQIFYISDGGYFPQGYTAADLKDFYREYYPDFMTDRYSKLMDQFHLDEKRRISSYSKGMKKQLLVIMHKGGILLSRELEDMKFHIHKIQCVLPDQTKEEALLKELDVLKKEHQGSLLILTARGTREEILQKVQTQNPIFCEVIPLTLEEIFISETEVAGYEVKNIFW